MDTQNLKALENDIRDEAKKLLQKGTNALAFSERFFGPAGALRKLWTNKQDRKALVESDLYKWLQAQVAVLRRQEAKAFEQEVESLSGRLTVVVPKSLHSALKREAVLEGTSLSELIRLKLGIPYRDSANLLVSDRHGQPRGTQSRRT